MAAHVPQRTGVVGLITGLFLIKNQLRLVFLFGVQHDTAWVWRPSSAPPAIVGCTEAALRFKLNPTQ